MKSFVLHLTIACVVSKCYLNGFGGLDIYGFIKFFNIRTKAFEIWVKSPRWLGFTRVKTILDRDTYINKEILQEILIKEESNLHCSSTISGRVTAEVNLVWGLQLY